ncbi:MAG: tetratricopeptide repeat protein [Bryobacteraceae bacterium]|nr:tetratricopeptide repeat protein [Bryobacteraceae bacterium]
MLPLLLVLLAQSPGVEQKAAQARALMEQGRFAEAAPLWGDLVKAMPGNPGLLLNLGMALHLAGEDAKAIPLLEQAAKGGAPPAFLFLGASYLRTGQPTKAMAPLKRFVAADPRHVEARLMLVDAAQGQATEALPHLEVLSRLDAARPAVWYQLGRAYEEFAFAEFAQLGKQFPESGPWFALLADSRSKTSQNRAAFFFYRKALAKSPGMRGLHAAVAEIYRRAGEPSWALSEDAAEVKLGEPVCKVMTAECAFAAGKLSQTLALARPLRTAEGAYWRVRAYDGLAREAFGRLNALPESPEGYRFQAETLREQQKYAESVAAWREALRLAPGHPDYTRELISGLLQTRDYAEAQKLLDAAPEKSPDLNFLQGDLLLNQQLADQAIPFLEKAAKQDPNLLAARAALARALLQAGQPAAALPHATAALSLDTDGSLHFQLARAYQAAGQAEPARAAMAKYQEIKARNTEQERLAEEQARITPP